jgi:VWFA-related protein
MTRAVLFSLLACAASFAQTAARNGADGDPNVTFHSDVSLVRVDAQVVDSSNRPIIHLHAGDFVLRLNGQQVPVTNFAADNMPIDVLFLLDVSGSMRPHVQRIADASGQALNQLTANDRMGIMVFDRYTRVRLPFNTSKQEVQRGFDRLLREERFNGGTDITRAMLDAADYISEHGRRDARRAIVILTDDMTEFDRDEVGVGRALSNANAVLCALIAPDAMPRGYGRRGGGGGPWGGGPGLGGPLGGIIFGRGGSPGGGGGGQQQHSAGTSEIARDSGGDSMSVNDASALEDTLERLRQRYTLYFNLPEGARPGDEGDVRVDLAPQARSRFSDAEVHYRRMHMAPADDASTGNAPADDGDERPHLTRRPHSDSGNSTASSSSDASSSNGSDAPIPHHHVAVNEDGTPISGSGPR